MHSKDIQFSGMRSLKLLFDTSKINFMITGINIIIEEWFQILDDGEICMPAN